MILNSALRMENWGQSTARKNDKIRRKETLEGQNRVPPEEEQFKQGAARRRYRL